MARMSIDDSLSRDTKLDHLAELCGWTKRETAGCLQLDIWPLCYDRVTPNIPPADLDRAAARGAVSLVKHPGGFAAALIESNFARKSTREDVVYRWEKDDGSVAILEWRDHEWRNRIYLRGAAERIAYLLKKKVSGRIGGNRSAISRSSGQAVLQAPLEQCSSTGIATANPSASASSTPIPNTDPATPAGAPAGLLDEVKEKARKHAADRAAKIPDRAWKAADYLREQVLADDPAALVHLELWGDEVRTGWRLKWADEIRLMVARDGRTYEQIAEVLRYVFREQTGTKRFIVQSADALREKFDAIQAVRRNHRPEKPTKPAAIPIAQGSLGGVK